MTPRAGRHVRRIQDPRLVRGEGRFTDDHRVPGALHAVVVRSLHAHARIRALETRPARAAPGVVAVFTAADAAAAGLRPLPFQWPPHGFSAGPAAAPAMHPLAADLVRHVGEPVALVVARTAAAGADAAERVEVEYEPLAAAVDPRDALRPDAPSVSPGGRGNLLGVWELGDAAACDAALRAAHHVSRLRVTNNALAPAPLEPRACIGLWDPETGRYTLHAGLQAPHLARGILAEALGVGEDRVRVVVGDVGGGFGGKATPYREDVLVLWAARLVGRPVRWCATRTEAFLGDHRGRDQDAEVTLALDADGRILALRAEVLLNVGAFPSHFGLPIATSTGHRIVTGVYHIPRVHVRLRAVLTHTPPTGPYRGAGRPEAIHRLERVLDLAALELGRDPVDLRRRNLIPAGAIPYTTPAGQRYDSGDFARLLARALAAADWDGFPARRAAARARGRLRGRGVCCHIDSTSGLTPTETARVVLGADGAIEVFSGTQEIGQGIQTGYAQLVASRLGVEPGRVRVVQGDTDRVAAGGGTYGSRSLHVGGSAVAAAADAALDRVKALAAARLEAAASDVEVRDGRCRVVGTEAAVTLAELAAGSPDGRIDCTASATSPFCFPNGAYACEVEIDPETGVIEVARFVAVDDAGVLVNVPIVEGQAHGAIAQGIAQALWEHVRHDAGSGQLLTASFMEYPLPRAADLPAPTVLHDETLPATTNLLGAKGAGESGAVGAPPAVVAAVVDALREFGVAHLDMPITPETVWRIAGRLAPGPGAPV